ncbi:MAG: hypothetical protein ACP6IQ_02350 [Candidatus Njordarchaeia archaeon]
MPDPKDFKSKKDFLKVCIPTLIKEGKSQDQAVAVCNSMWKNRNKKIEAKMDNLDKTLPPELQEVLTQVDNIEGGSDTDSKVRRAGASSESRLTSEQEPNNLTGEKSMADQTITKEDIRKEVEAMLAEKDAQAKIQEKIEQLESEKASLSAKVEEVEAAKAEISSELEKVKADLENISKEKEALAKEKEEVDATVAQLQKELDGIKAEQALAQRKNELAEAGILLDGEKGEAQLAKVKEMSDEAFASYKEELIQFKEMFGTANQQEENKDENEDKAKASENKESGSEDSPSKSVANVIAPDVSDGEVFRQAVAAATASVALDEDQVSLYSQM